MHGFAFFALVLCATLTNAWCIESSDLEQVEGWTIYAVTQIDGEFQGCEQGRHLNYINGMHTICDDIGVDEDESPDAIIFTKFVKGKNFDTYLVKAWIDDEFFDMRPIVRRARHTL